MFVLLQTMPITAPETDQRPAVIATCLNFWERIATVHRVGSNNASWVLAHLPDTASLDVFPIRVKTTLDSFMSPSLLCVLGVNRRPP